MQNFWLKTFSRVLLSQNTCPKQLLDFCSWGWGDRTYSLAADFLPGFVELYWATQKTNQRLFRWVGIYRVFRCGILRLSVFTEVFERLFTVSIFIGFGRGKSAVLAECQLKHVIIFWPNCRRELTVKLDERRTLFFIVFRKIGAFFWIDFTRLNSRKKFTGRWLLILHDLHVDGWGFVCLHKMNAWFPFEIRSFCLHLFFIRWGHVDLFSYSLGIVFCTYYAVEVDRSAIFLGGQFGEGLDLLQNTNWVVPLLDAEITWWRHLRAAHGKPYKFWKSLALRGPRRRGSLTIYYFRIIGLKAFVASTANFQWWIAWLRRSNVFF